MRIHIFCVHYLALILDIWFCNANIGLARFDDMRKGHRSHDTNIHSINRTKLIEQSQMARCPPSEREIMFSEVHHPADMCPCYMPLICQLLLIRELTNKATEKPILNSSYSQPFRMKLNFLWIFFTTFRPFFHSWMYKIYKWLETDSSDMDIKADTLEMVKWSHVQENTFQCNNSIYKLTKLVLIVSHQRERW